MPQHVLNLFIFYFFILLNTLLLTKLYTHYIVLDLPCLHVYNIVFAKSCNAYLKGI